MQRCRICHHPLPVQERGRKRRYCSATCKMNAYRARKNGTPPKKSRRTAHKPPACLVCDRPLVRRTTGRKPRYCSARCRQKAYRTRRFHNALTYTRALQNNRLRWRHRSKEWYTPREYIAAYRLVLGEIELDPASSEAANQTVQAQRYFDKETNGLLQEWRARSVYLNPPHDHVNTTAAWTGKLLAEYRAGNIDEALLLVESSTETQWFAPLWDFPMCFVQGRIRFVSGDGLEASQPINGSAFVYLGRSSSTFVRVFEHRLFRHFGDTARLLDIR